MTFWERFLAFLSTILGEDSELVTRLQDAEPATDEEIEAAAFPEDATDEQRELLATTYNVADDDLDEAVAAIRDAAGADDDDSLTTEQVLEAADLIDGVHFVEEVRDEAAEQEATARDEALQRIRGENADDADDDPEDPDADPEDPDDPEEGGEADPDPDADPEDPEAAVDPELEPITAGGRPNRPRIGRVAARGRTPRRDPVPAGQATGRRDWRLLDRLGDGDIGDTLSHDDFVEAVCERLDDFAVATSDNRPGKLRLGRHVRDYPEERRLGQNAGDNGRTVAELVRGAQEEAARQATPGDAIDTLLAGALCVLPTPIYEIAAEGSTAMPVHDFLTSLQAARGGVSQRPGMKLADTIGAVDTDASGVTIWSMTNQADPGTDGPAVKRVLSVVCPEENVESEVYAVVARLQFDNFMARYDPELVSTVTMLQEVATARIAETEVISAIHAASVNVVAPEPVVGFSREYLSNVEWLVTGIRSSNRLPETFVFDHLAPFWVRIAMRDDMMRELPGSADERMAVADAEIDRWFRERGIRSGWFIDTQQIGVQAAGAQIRHPLTVTSYVFEPGHHVLLDGGREDFGFVRDSTLLDTNHVQTFGEVMEATHSPGLWSYRLVQDVCLTGATSGTVDVPCVPTSG